MSKVIGFNLDRLVSTDDYDAMLTKWMYDPVSFGVLGRLYSCIIGLIDCGFISKAFYLVCCGDSKDVECDFGQFISRWCGDYNFGSLQRYYGLLGKGVLKTNDDNYTESDYPQIVNKFGLKLMQASTTMPSNIKTVVLNCPWEYFEDDRYTSIMNGLSAEVRGALAMNWNDNPFYGIPQYRGGEKNHEARIGETNLLMCGALVECDWYHVRDTLVVRYEDDHLLFFNEQLDYDKSKYKPVYFGNSFLFGLKQLNSDVFVGIGDCTELLGIDDLDNYNYESNSNDDIGNEVKMDDASPQESNFTNDDIGNEVKNYNLADTFIRNEIFPQQCKLRQKLLEWSNVSDVMALSDLFLINMKGTNEHIYLCLIASKLFDICKCILQSTATREIDSNYCLRNYIFYYHELSKINSDSSLGQVLMPETVPEDVRRQQITHRLMKYGLKRSSKFKTKIDAQNINDYGKVCDDLFDTFFEDMLHCGDVKKVNAYKLIHSSNKFMIKDWIKSFRLVFQIVCSFMVEFSKYLCDVASTNFQQWSSMCNYKPIKTKKEPEYRSFDKLGHFCAMLLCCFVQSNFWTHIMPILSRGYCLWLSDSQLRKDLEELNDIIQPCKTEIHDVGIKNKIDRRTFLACKAGKIIANKRSHGVDIKKHLQKQLK